MTSDRTRTSAFAVEALWNTGSLRQAAKDRAVDDADCGVLAHLYRIEPFVSDGLGLTDRGAEVPGGTQRVSLLPLDPAAGLNRVVGHGEDTN